MQDEIDRLEDRTVIIGEVNEEREKYLLDIETRFNELVATGMSKEQAAKQMGYTRNYLWKVLNELNRIRKEKSAKKENGNQKFRKKLSDMSKYGKTTLTTESIPDNGEEKGLNSENGIKDDNSAR